MCRRSKVGRDYGMNDGCRGSMQTGSRTVCLLHFVEDDVGRVDKEERHGDAVMSGVDDAASRASKRRFPAQAAGNTV